VRLRARRQAAYRELRDKPAITRDGTPVNLLINAGLLVDLPHLKETGARGIGLFRTELQFMVAATFPRIGEQFELYKSVLDAAGTNPVTFRSLDIGGDKILPYMEAEAEENPALGWRAIRLTLDRPGLLRSQVARAPDGRARPRASPDVPDDHGGRRVRPGQGARRSRAPLRREARP
jgi:phosphotransferase system enzyme I (PtsP)